MPNDCAKMLFYLFLNFHIFLLTLNKVTKVCLIESQYVKYTTHLLMLPPNIDHHLNNLTGVVYSLKVSKYFLFTNSTYKIDEICMFHSLIIVKSYKINYETYKFHRFFKWNF